MGVSRLIATTPRTPARRPRALRPHAHRTGARPVRTPGIVASARSRGDPIRTRGPPRPEPGHHRTAAASPRPTPGCCRHRRASAPAQTPPGPIPSWPGTSTTIATIRPAYRGRAPPHPPDTHPDHPIHRAAGMTHRHDNIPSPPRVTAVPAPQGVTAPKRGPTQHRTNGSNGNPSRRTLAEENASRTTPVQSPIRRFAPANPASLPGSQSTTPGIERWLAELPDGDWDAGRLPSAVLSVAARAMRCAGQPGEISLARVLSRGGRWVVLHGAPLMSEGERRVAVIVEPAHPARIYPLLMAAYGLTERERDVTRLILQGGSTAQIAHELVVSTHTVQQHLKSIFDKTGVRSRRDLVGKVFFAHYEPRFRDNEHRVAEHKPVRGGPVDTG